MNREQFEHSVRAAGAVLGVSEILVIGSQALHGTIAGPLPVEASRSVEVDVAVFEEPDERGADLIDGSIGEASMFILHSGTTRMVWRSRRRSCRRDDIDTASGKVDPLDERVRQLVQARITR